MPDLVDAKNIILPIKIINKDLTLEMSNKIWSQQCHRGSPGNLSITILW